MHPEVRNGCGRPITPLIGLRSTRVSKFLIFHLGDPLVRLKTSSTTTRRVLIPAIPSAACSRWNGVCASREVLMNQQSLAFVGTKASHGVTTTRKKLEAGAHKGINRGLYAVYAYQNVSHSQCRGSMRHGRQKRRRHFSAFSFWKSSRRSCIVTRKQTRQSSCFAQSNSAYKRPDRHRSRLKDHSRGYRMTVSKSTKVGKTLKLP